MGHDAFGRQTDEDPIEAMGWQHSPGSHQGKWALEDSPPREAVNVEIAPEREPTRTVRRAERQAAMRPPGMPSGVTVLRPARMAMRMVLLIVVVSFAIPIVIGVIAAIREIDTSGLELPGSDVEFAPPVAPTPADDGDEGEEPAAAAPRATTMLTSAEMRRAIREMRRLVPGVRPALVRVDARRLDVQARGGGKIVGLQASPGKPAEVLYRNDSPAGPTTFAWSQINPLAAPRLAAQAKDLDYAVLLRSPELRWTVFRKGKAWQAGPDGRGLRRLGAG